MIALEEGTLIARPCGSRRCEIGELHPRVGEDSCVTKAPMIQPLRQGELRRPESRLLQAVIFQDAPAVEELLQEGTNLSKEVLEYEDEYGYTCCLWSASRGHHRLLKALIGAGANPLHVAHGGKTDATTALHVCAATGRFGSKSDERKGYLECAAVLVAAGANPFAENGKGMTAIEVAIHHGNPGLKAYLEGSAIFRSTILMPAAKMLGGNDWAERHCVVHPRVYWDPAVLQAGGRQLETRTPVLWMWCYKSATAMRPVCQIPLTSAYVELDSSPASDNEAHALLILESKVALKGVLGTTLGPDNLAVELVGRAEVLRELAFLCSSVQRAAEKGNLAELCRAAMITNFKQQQLLLASFSSSADLERQPSSPGWVTQKTRLQLASTPRSANGSLNTPDGKDLMASTNSAQSTDPAVVWLSSLNGPSHSMKSNISEQEDIDGGSTPHSQDADAGWGGIGRAMRRAKFSNSLQRSRRSISFSVAGLAGSLGRRSEQAGAAVPTAEDRIIEVGNGLKKAGDSDASANRTGLVADTDVTGIVERPLQPGEDDGVRKQPPPRVLDLLAHLTRRSQPTPAAADPLAEHATIVGVPEQQAEAAVPVHSAQKQDGLLQQLAKRLHLRAGKGPAVMVGDAEPTVEEQLEQWRAQQGSLSPRDLVGQAPLINPEFWGESIAEPASPARELLSARVAIEEEGDEDEPTPVVAFTKDKSDVSEQNTAGNCQQHQGSVGSPAVKRIVKPANDQERAFVRSKEDSGHPRVTTEAERMEAAKRMLDREQARALKHTAKVIEDDNGPLRSILESPAASSEAGSVFDSMSSDSDDTAMFEEEVRILRHRRALAAHARRP